MKEESGERFTWIEAASAAGIKDEEANLRKQALLDRTLHRSGPSIDAQVGAYVQLERSRMEFAELAQTMEACAPLLKPALRRTARVAEVQAYRDAGDEAAELRVLRRIGLEQGNDANLRERSLQL